MPRVRQVREVMSTCNRVCNDGPFGMEQCDLDAVCNEYQHRTSFTLYNDSRQNVTIIQYNAIDGSHDFIRHRLRGLYISQTSAGSALEPFSHRHLFSGRHYLSSQHGRSASPASSPPLCFGSTHLQVDWQSWGF